jgi:hypothetical protein
MLLCELPSENDLNFTDDPFWADNDIYDCSDFKFPTEEKPKDNRKFIIKLNKRVKKALYKNKYPAIKKNKNLKKIDILMS